MTPQQLEILKRLRLGASGETVLPMNQAGPPPNPEFPGGGGGAASMPPPTQMDPRLAKLMAMKGSPSVGAMPPVRTMPMASPAPPIASPTLKPEAEEMARLDTDIASATAPKPKQSPWSTILKGAMQGIAYGENAPQMARLQDQEAQADIAAKQKRMEYLQQQGSNRATAQTAIENRQTAQANTEVDQEYRKALTAQAYAAADRPQVQPSQSAPRAVNNDTVDTAEGVMQFNEKTGLFDIRVGGRPVTGRTTAVAKPAPGTPPQTPGGAPPLSGLAQSILRDPAILRTLTPTDRGKIYEELGRSGQIPQTRFVETVDRGLDTIKSLKAETTGKSGSIGLKNWTSAFGLRDEPAEGSPEADYAFKVKQLISLLTLPELELMKGLGQMSDREFNTLSSAATTLNRDLSEKAFDAEIDRVESSLNEIKNRAGTTAQPAGGQIRVISPSGESGSIPAEDWPAAEAEGYKRAQ